MASSCDCPFCTSCDCGFGVGDSAKEIVSIHVGHVIATACDCGFPELVFSCLDGVILLTLLRDYGLHSEASA